MTVDKTGHARPRRAGAACLAGIVLAGLALGACRETNRYMARRDTITPGAGDAAAHNAAIHTIDPWPRHSRNTHLTADGKRMMVGIKRYQANESIDPAGENTAEGFEQEDAPAAPSPGRTDR